MMIFRKDNKPPLQFSTMRSNPAMLQKDETPRSSFREGISRCTVAKKATITKPSHISKRSVSLPTDLQKPSVKTRKLFWFIPKENRRQRRSSRQNNDCPKGQSSCEISGPITEQRIESIRNDQGPPLCLDIPEKVALEWITTSSTHSLSDNSTSDQSDDFCFDDDQDDTLLGLEFLDSQIDEHR